MNLTKPENRDKLRAIVRLVAVVATALVLFFWRRPTPEPDDHEPAVPSKQEPDQTRNAPPPQATSHLERPTGDTTVDGAAALVLRIEAAWKRLQALEARNASQDERLAVVLALRAELRAASQSQAAEAVLHYLETNNDVSTGLPFAPARDGFLET